MVTKLPNDSVPISLKSYSSKNPYGNKTAMDWSHFPEESYSSKNPYGNKTVKVKIYQAYQSYSSKNPYGNKTRSNS